MNGSRSPLARYKGGQTLITPLSSSFPSQQTGEGQGQRSGSASGRRRRRGFASASVHAPGGGGRARWRCALGSRSFWRLAALGPRAHDGGARAWRWQQGRAAAPCSRLVGGDLQGRAHTGRRGAPVAAGRWAALAVARRHLGSSASGLRPCSSVPTCARRRRGQSALGPSSGLRVRFCRTSTAAVGQTPGLLARLVLGRGACTSSGRQRFGTSGPIHGERRQSLPCIALVVSGGGR
jgi:hypothetical protein